jgi:hypothetical protein
MTPWLPCIRLHVSGREPGQALAAAAAAAAVLLLLTAAARQQQSAHWVEFSYCKISL